MEATSPQSCGERPHIPNVARSEQRCSFGQLWWIYKRAYESQGRRLRWRWKTRYGVGLQRSGRPQTARSQVSVSARRVLRLAQQCKGQFEIFI
jgi:hypothetical protein